MSTPRSALTPLPHGRPERDLPPLLDALLADVRERERHLREWHARLEIDLRTLAAGLVDHGYSRREVAEVLGLSGYLVAKLLGCRGIERT